MMTKKNFEAIAKILKDADKAGNIRYPETLANYFCDYFERENTRFDQSKFRKACGLNQGLKI